MPQSNTGLLGKGHQLQGVLYTALRKTEGRIAYTSDIIFQSRQWWQRKTVLSCFDLWLQFSKDTHSLLFFKDLLHATSFEIMRLVVRPAYYSYSRKFRHILASTLALATPTQCFSSVATSNKKMSSSTVSKINVPSDNIKAIEGLEPQSLWNHFATLKKED